MDNYHSIFKTTVEEVGVDKDSGFGKYYLVWMFGSSELNFLGSNSDFTFLLAT
jgi:hypothetical protein